MSILKNQSQTASYHFQVVKFQIRPSHFETHFIFGAMTLAYF